MSRLSVITVNTAQSKVQQIGVIPLYQTVLPLFIYEIIAAM